MLNEKNLKIHLSIKNRRKFNNLKQKVILENKIKSLAIFTWHSLGPVWYQPTILSLAATWNFQKLNIYFTQLMNDNTQNKKTVKFCTKF